ncbi:DUF2927 domain-containing protein [Mycolicibacterium austroafricanum]|uniref:DUF2927 domain-containing protein n=1 Tax=Mycolicibacterium austroafricanum TaxID=39687 RepID=UPI001ABF97D9|nr:DUF2927 domain-containing protein [Mycolicibacterium austroafricanum]QRZ08172.1 DUF2927 domain-containing protein [Mycolicibacterium austroafricanum]
MFRLTPRIAAVAVCAPLSLVAGCAADGADDSATHVSRTVSMTPLISITTLRAAPGPAIPEPPPPTPDPKAVTDYFSEIAFGTEYGQSDLTIHKWTRNPRITVHGAPRPTDLTTLSAVVGELNDIINTIHLEIVPTGGDIDVHFAPEHEFAALASDYVPGNVGFFTSWWRGQGEMTKGRVLVSTTITDQVLRDHTIREEITQVLGLANDSFTHPDSIFHQDIATATRFSDIDRRVIDLLYHPQIIPGMTRSEALAAVAAAS